MGNVAHFPARAGEGLAFAAGPVLRAGVVLLGFDFILADLLALGPRALAVVIGVVAVSFLGTLWAGRQLGCSAGLTLLVATGFSICGVSAIAAVKDVVDADEDDVAFAIALVTLCGTLAVVTLPALREPLSLDPQAFGAWAGASVHDIGQVVATSSTAGTVALSTAIVVKLTRVILLVPVVALIALSRDSTTSSRKPRHLLIPPFIIFFLLAIIISSVGFLPPWTTPLFDELRTFLLGMALFAIGTRVNVRRLTRIGTTPLALGLLSWLLIAGVSYAGVRVAW